MEEEKTTAAPDNNCKSFYHLVDTSIDATGKHLYHFVDTSLDTNTDFQNILEVRDTNSMSLNHFTSALAITTRER